MPRVYVCVSVWAHVCREFSSVQCVFVRVTVHVWRVGGIRRLILPLNMYICVPMCVCTRVVFSCMQCVCVRVCWV